MLARLVAATLFRRQCPQKISQAEGLNFEEAHLQMTKEKIKIKRTAKATLMKLMW